MTSSKITLTAIAVMTIALGSLAVSKFDSTGERTGISNDAQTGQAAPKIDTLKLLGRLNTAE